MSQRRTNYLPAQDAVANCDLLRVFRPELLAHYELPKDLPHVTPNRQPKDGARPGASSVRAGECRGMLPGWAYLT